MANSTNINQNINVVTLQDSNGNLSITNNNTGTTVSITQPVTNVVTVATVGPQGPVGPIPTSGSFTGSFFGSFTGSLQGTASNAISSSYALTASYLQGYVSPFPFSGSAVITGSLTVSGSSTLTNIGPAIFSGSLIVTEGITSSLFGTASNAVSSSYTQNATSASYALTASYFSGYVSPFPFTGSAIISGSLTVTGSVQATDGFSGSFSGSGANLFDIPASGITGLNLSRIATGSVSASVSPGTASFAIVSGSSTFMFVSSSGNVGIRTTTPSSPLHIKNSTTNYLGGLTLEKSDASLTYNLYVDGSNGFAIAKGASGQYFTINQSGNVLVNTTTDAGFKLDVNGTARVVTSIEVNSKTLGGGASALATNTAYGQNTLTAISANGYNTAIGYIALQNNTGTINTAVGAYALTQNSSGTQNVALGGYAGSSITSGGNNVVIGYNAQLGSGGQSNEIVIGYNAVGLGSNTTVIGNSSTTFGRWWGNLLIGTSTNIGYTLNVSGSTNITGDLTVTGSATLTGALTASNATISGNVTVLGTASISTLIVNQIGYSSGSNQLGDAVDDTQTLYGTVRIPTGSLIVSGALAVTSSATIQTLTVGLGNSAVSTNTALGNLTLRDNTTGFSNVATGFQALRNNTSGASNTANGVQALVNNLTGTNNASFGQSSLLVNTSGGNNTAIGFQALQANTTANNNTSLGFNSGASNTTGANNIFIGANSTGVSATESNRTWIGNSSTTSTWLAGNVLIGTTTDAGYLLDVNGSARSTAFRLTDNTLIASAYTVGGTTLTISNGGHYGSIGINVSSATGIRAVSTIGIDINGVTGASIYAAGGSTGGRISLGLLSNRALITSTASGMAMHTSSMLQVDSTTQGFLPPRTNLTSNISAPAQGLMTYLTGSTNEGLYYYSSGSIRTWTRLLNDTGSQAISGSLTITGSNPLLRLNGSGSELMSVDGASGRLFTVSDDLSNSLFSVNTIAGLPVIEAFATNDVFLGKYNTYPIKTVASGTLAVITGSISGSVAAPGSTTQIVYNNGGVLGANSGLVYSSSRVGINTSTPAYTLDVSGDIRLGNDNSIYLIGTRFLTNNSSIYMGDINAQNTPFYIVPQGGGANGSARFGGGQTFLVKGAGTTSATTTLLIQNSAASTNFTIRDDGSTSLNAFKGGQLSIGDGSGFGANQMRIYLEGVSTGYTYIDGYSDGTNKANNAPIVFGARLNNVGSSLSGASTIENGTPVIFGFNTWNLSALVAINSTTRGFLPPRTNLTSNISTPAQGLITYVTASATEGLYYYNSGSYQGWTRTLNDSGSQTITNGTLSVYSTAGNGIAAYVGSNAMIMTGNAGYGNPGIGSTSGIIHVNATLNGTGGSEVLNVNKSINGAYIQAWRSWSSTILSLVDGNGNFAIRRTTATASLDVAGTTRISGSFNTATSGSILTVIGSGSAQPIFTVQGSQGELFSITDSLSGSLFSVNDISGLPILEVFSDNTTLIGNYQDPMLITTAKIVQTNSGSFTVYSLPTASYDTAFFEYSVKSGSNARAGTIMAIQLGSTVNFTETTTTDFGDTTPVSFTVIVTGSNMALTGSSTTGSWTIKTIVRGL